MHSLTPDGLDAIDDGLDCINVFVYYACDNETRVPNELWKLLPQMLYIVAGNADDVDGGFAHEYLGQVCIILQNFVCKDPTTFMSIGEGQTETYFELTFKFVQRILVINHNSIHKQDGVTVLRVVIALLENLPGQIDHALPLLVGMILAENKIAFETECPPNYRSMVLQTISMAIYNSNVTTLRIIEQEQQTFTVFSNWLQYMSKFKLEFEIRRIVWGLLAILKTPGTEIPPMVQQQLPEITKQMSGLAHKVHKERVKNLENNEKHIANGFESSDDEEDDDEDFNEDPEENPNIAFNEIKAKMQSFKDGKPVEGANVSGSDDDDDDSDFEDAAGEFALYDSPLESTDELLSIKETLDMIFQADQNAYQYITSTQTEEERNAFIEIIGKADELKAREAACKEAYEQNEMAQKIKSVKT